MEYKPLSELVDFVSDKIDTNKLLKKNYISTENMIPEKGGVTDAIKIPSGKVNAFRESDTLFSNIRTYFKKIWQADRHGGASPDVLVFRSRDSKKLLPDYLYYILSDEKFIAHTITTAKGVKMPRGDKEAIMQFVVAVPEISYQCKSSKVLRGFDRKISLNRQINQTLEQMGQAIFKSWFVDFEPVKAKIAILKAGGSQEDATLAAMEAISGKDQAHFAQLQSENPEQYHELRATAELFPSVMQNSESGPIPKGWAVKRIGDIVERVSVGKKYSQKMALQKGSIPILDQGKLGVIGYHNDAPGILASPNSPIIVFANHTCYMRLIMQDFSAIQNVLPFRGRKLDIYWIYYATSGKQQFIEYKGHWPDFIIKDVIVPSDGLDKLFGRYVCSLMHMANLNDRRNSTLALCRDALLQKSLAGELEL